MGKKLFSGQKQKTKKSELRSSWLEFLVPDVHFAHGGPNGVKPMDRHDPGALSILFQVMKDYRPDGVTQVGDLVHLGYLSHWNVGKGIGGRVKAETGETIEMCLPDDHALARRFWQEIRQICGKSARLRAMEGNHEEIIREARQMPIYAPLVKKMKGNDWFCEKAWGLEELNVSWTAYQNYAHPDESGKPGHNSLDVGPHLKVIHGHHAGAQHEQAHFMEWLTNLRYGHLHTKTAKPFKGPKGAFSVGSIGCLATKTASYHRGRHNPWWSGFEMIYLDKEGRFFSSYVDIIQNRACVNGKMYYAKPDGWLL